MELIRFAECPEVPWANGLGVTRQLLRDGAEPDPWNWRLSVATVSGAGPFSRLPGVDRVLVCVGPVALSLSIDGQAQHAQPGSAISFAGESDVASVGTAETRDVNVMVRRATAEALTEVLAPGRPVLHERGSEITAFVALSDGTMIGSDVLAIGDTAIVEAHDARDTSISRGTCLRVAILMRSRRPADSR